MEENSSEFNDNKANGNYLVTQKENNESQTHKSIGELLREAREAKNFSVEMISRHTKINTSTLHAIENEDIDSLPNIAYLRGFVKSYAKIVNVDEKLALQKLKKLYEPKTGSIESFHNEETINHSPEAQAIDEQSDVIAESHETIDTEPSTNTVNEKAPAPQEHQKEKSSSGAGLKVVGLLAVVGLTTMLVVKNKSVEAPSDNSSPEVVKPIELSESTPLKVHKVDETKELLEEKNNEIILKETESNSNETKKAEAQKLAAEKAAKEKLAAEKAAQEKAAQEKAAQEKAAQEKLAAEKEAQEKAAAEKLAQEKAAAEKEAKEREATTKEEVEQSPQELSATAKKEKIKLQKEVKFYNIPLPMFNEVNDQEALKEFVPERFQNAVVADKQNLFIHATEGDTWITYQKDNEAIKKFVLSKGRFLMIRADEIKIFFGNVNATKIFLNNKLLEIKTRSGVKSLVFPKEVAAKTMLPLFVFKDDGSVISSKDYIESNQENP